MHMLQSGVDLTIIKTCLGHVNLSTTHDYLEIDIDMKRKALSACAPLEMPDKLKRLTDRNRDVIKWLDSLSAHPSDKLRAQPLCDLAAS
jgi:integrase/recombinase XerD